MYLSERSEEVRVLCDPRLRTALDAFGITLCSFDDWKARKKLIEQPVP
jgi:hypothetical protein